MTEKDLNRIIFNAFSNQNQFGHKISDDAQNFKRTNKKPFDGFAVAENGIYFIESKLLKTSLGSFNFNKLEDHQIDNLQTIARIRKDVFPLVAIGWWVKRGFFKLAFLHIDLIIYLISLNKGSILKKEILLLDDKDLLFEIKKQSFDILEIPNKIIDVEKWKEIF